MPTKITTLVSAVGSTPMNPFIGINPAAPIAIPIAATSLTSAEVDAYGYLKPGVPFQRSGALVTAGTGQTIFGITIEPIKIAASNAAADLTAAGTPEVAVKPAGVVSRAIMESNLGRALSANELAIFLLSPWFRLIA
jgi:hypothetical protein